MRRIAFNLGLVSLLLLLLIGVQALVLAPVAFAGNDYGIRTQGIAPAGASMIVTHANDSSQVVLTQYFPGRRNCPLGYDRVPGHYNRYGEWVPGHWRHYVWTPGHYNRFGNWVPGRCRSVVG